MESLANVVKNGSVANELMTDLSQPVLLEHDGAPVAALISIEEYERYQQFVMQRVTGSEARRAANRVVFGDLVGLALACGEPVWVPEPHAQWRIPYRALDGTLLALVMVDAHTVQVQLTDDERAALLAKVTSHYANNHAST